MLRPDDNAGETMERFDQTLEQHNRRITALEIGVRGLLKVFLLYGSVKLIYKVLKK